MIKNNLEINVNVKCLEEGRTQAQLAEKVGTSAPYVNRIINKSEGVINKTFISMMEQLGYDIEISYIKKEHFKKITHEILQRLSIKRCKHGQ